MECAHNFDFECRKAVDNVSGQIPKCRAVRSDQDLCGPDGKWFEQRYHITAYVNEAPITKTSVPQDNKPSLGQMYEEDDPGIQQRIQDQKLKPFTDYKHEDGSPEQE